jgi:hypothetical protein
VTGTQIPNPAGSGAPATTSGTSVTESGLHVVFGAGQVGRSLAAQIAGPVLPVRGVSLHRPSTLTTTTNAEARFAAAKINLAGRPPRPPSLSTATKTSHTGARPVHLHLRPARLSLFYAVPSELHRMTDLL